MVKLGHIIRLITAFALGVQATPPALLASRGGGKKGCPPLRSSGDFIIDYYQLYPENADWDQDSCLLWIGSVLVVVVVVVHFLHLSATNNFFFLKNRSLWNATVAIYDPYARRILDVLSFPGISLTLAHIGGVAWDPYSGLITILSNSPRPWATAGADITDERQVMKYDPKHKKVLWARNLTDISRDRYGGFQDVETDRRGNTYIVGTYPGVILRADKTGKKLTEWYLHPSLTPTTRKGFSGLAAVRDTDIMLATDGDGKLYRFDLKADKGKPVNVPIRPEVLYNDTDAIYLPPKYGGKVLLVASLLGGIQVLRSKDSSWRTTEYLGTIPLPARSVIDTGAITAPVQVGSGSLFMVVGYIDFPFAPGTVAGPRSKFPFVDITAEVDALLKK